MSKRKIPVLRRERTGTDNEKRAGKAFDKCTASEKKNVLEYVLNTIPEKMIIKLLNDSLFLDTPFKLKHRSRF